MFFKNISKHNFELNVWKKHVLWCAYTNIKLSRL